MILQILALSLFTAVMGIAALEDFRRLTIPNLLPLLLCAGWPLYVAAAPVPGGMLGAALGAAGCALAVFLGGAALFARGWIGGGDVKLLSAATLWAGAPQALGLLVVTGLLGGALALILLSPFGKFASAARQLLGPPDTPPSHPGVPEPAVPVPYGVAIAGAGLIVVVSPHIA
jgi:prepilin peptidase CpaA